MDGNRCRVEAIIGRKVEKNFIIGMHQSDGAVWVDFSFEGYFQVVTKPNPRKAGVGVDFA